MKELIALEQKSEKEIKMGNKNIIIINVLITQNRCQPIFSCDPNVN